MLTNRETGTNIQEIAHGIYRINTPVELPGGPGFSFNQYLVVDEHPLLFHTGPRKLFAPISQAIAAVMPVEKLRYVGLSHFEADECGSLNDFLALAPQASPLCGTIAAMVSVNDVADRTATALADGQKLVLGSHTMQWFDTPHVPHGWECGMMMDASTGTFFCGDLFTQPGSGKDALTRDDILGPSEAFRGAMDYYAHGRNTGAILARLADQNPTTLACMHGSAWSGDGGALLRQLAASVG
ncbi:MAG: MBL fold metallo-hydrolase [Rhodoferax sp.]|nr:MBL fold metallo-hydrolase [Rhodoferax sp.]